MFNVEENKIKKDKKGQITYHDFVICCFFFYRLLDSDREPITDVPAVYFVMPTDENVKLICKVRNELQCCAS